MKNLILILITLLLLVGCGKSSYTEQQVFDAFLLCNKNDGVQKIKAGTGFYNNNIEVYCKNDARFIVEVNGTIL